MKKKYLPLIFGALLLLVHFFFVTDHSYDVLNISLIDGFILVLANIVFLMYKENNEENAWIFYISLFLSIILIFLTAGLIAFMLLVSLIPLSFHKAYLFDFLDSQKACLLIGIVIYSMLQFLLQICLPLKKQQEREIFENT